MCSFICLRVEVSFDPDAIFALRYAERCYRRFVISLVKIMTDYILTLRFGAKIKVLFVPEHSPPTILT